ncbi:transcriptional regulator [Hydrogenophaga crassostreae]|uniref:Transcriptional regulator n=1 Tax=Hydrogenophaga crassostreae TaxID=1763535 RepID=A0A162T0S0_9BURK|nr:LysR family transcriptional regulator [Hydrogenophaga crassostreae]AOW14117.1 LysR family transcriptional regulator [Hydrogenophaga crassostreae]OAD42161.1 transcriptional regulator [Hydrogenophaga crassostreae]
MNEFDWSDLDARLLRLLVAVVETGSITRAAHNLGVAQSAVSHQLTKLRVITGDLLFVKSGRGIVATAHAELLAGQARELLRQLQGFAHAGAFDPATWRTRYTIAANDFQRDALLPALATCLREQAPGVALRIIPSGVPTLEMLRDGACDLAISPRPPDGTDILQKRLFEDQYRVYFDPAMRAAPRSLSEYLAADHITVLYEPRRQLDVDRQLADQGVDRRFSITVPGFSGLPAFLTGSTLLATAPALLAGGLMRGFASARVPVKNCPRLPMYLIWHARTQQDAAHRWMRQQIEAVVPPLLKVATTA